MARARPMQTSFTSGVVNPRLVARTDLQHYYDGLLRADNVNIRPQGGARVRGGFRYIDQAAELNARLVPFVFDRSNKYLLEFTNLQMRVFKDGVLQATVVTTLTTAQVDTMDYAQSYNALFLVHPDVQPQLVFRGGDDTTWSIGTLTFENIPDFDYNDASSPIPTTHDIQITFEGTWQAGDHYKLELDNFETPEIVYSSDTAANERRIAEELLKLPPTGLRAAGITVTYQSGTIYRIQFSGDSADAYEPMTGFNVDTAASRITETTRTTVGVSRREPAISSTRGWPKAVTLYEGRLWLGGLRSLPQHAIGSVVDDTLNLQVGDGFDDEAIFQALDTGQYNGIDYLHPGRHLQNFTEGGEFFYPARPITPANSGRPPQTKYGTAEVKPVEIDGATLFVTRSAQTLREYLYAQLEEAYNASSLSLLAADPLLSTGIVDMAGVSGVSADESSYVYTPTGDGNVAVLNTLRSQDIAAWSRYTTEGDIKRVAAVDDELYFLVHRTIGGTVVPYIERCNPGNCTTRTDSHVAGTQASSTVITGLDHLEGASVRAIGDGFVFPAQVVSGGQVVVSRAVTDYEVGLEFNPDIRSMPLNVDLGDGPLIGRTKSVPKLYVLTKDSAGVLAAFDVTDDPGEDTLQEQPDPLWRLDQTQTDSPPPTASGVREYGFMGSTDRDAIIRLYQRDPLPFEVLGFVASVEIGGE